MLAEEQAALRRVATVVARGAAPEAVFEAVIAEVGLLLPVEYAHMGRYEPDGSLLIVASAGREGPMFPVGARLILDGQNLGSVVAETSRPAQIDSWADASGPIAIALRERGVRWSVGTPIIVEGHLWGMIAAGSIVEQRLLPDTEGRLAAFTELLAMAVANAESRAGLARLAEEQTALRRVATLVAEGAPPKELFAAVTDEVGRLLAVDVVGLGRYEADGTVTTVAAWGGAAARFPVGGRPTLGGKNLVTTIFQTGRPARIDYYADTTGAFGMAARDMGLRSSVGTPVLVEARIWGVMVAGSASGQLPTDTEARLTSFTELVATAIANAESRAAVAASRARVIAAADESRRQI